MRRAGSDPRLGELTAAAPRERAPRPPDPRGSARATTRGDGPCGAVRWSFGGAREWMQHGCRVTYRKTHALPFATLHRRPRGPRFRLDTRRRSDCPLRALRLRCRNGSSLGFRPFGDCLSATDRRRSRRSRRARARRRWGARTGPGQARPESARAPMARKKSSSPGRRDDPHHHEVAVALVGDLVLHVRAEEARGPRDQRMAFLVRGHAPPAPEADQKLDLSAVGVGPHPPAGARSSENPIDSAPKPVSAGISLGSACPFAGTGLPPGASFPRAVRRPRVLAPPRCRSRPRSAWQSPVSRARALPARREPSRSAAGEPRARPRPVKEKRGRGGDSARSLAAVMSRNLRSISMPTKRRPRRSAATPRAPGAGERIQDEVAGVGTRPEASVDQGYRLLRRMLSELLLRGPRGVEPPDRLHLAAPVLAPHLVVVERVLERAALARLAGPQHDLRRVREGSAAHVRRRVRLLPTRCR